MAHKHPVLGSDEKDVEGLLQFSFGPAFDLHLLQSLPSYLCSKRTKGEANAALRANRDMEMAPEASSRIWNSHSLWVHNTIFSTC